MTSTELLSAIWTIREIVEDGKLPSVAIVRRVARVTRRDVRYLTGMVQRQMARERLALMEQVLTA